MRKKKSEIEIDEGNYYEEENKIEVKETESKATNTAFILMFPCLILAGMAVYLAPVWGSLLALALALYQFLMLKKFIEDYYKSK